MQALRKFTGGMGDDDDITDADSVPEDEDLAWRRFFLKPFEVPWKEERREITSSALTPHTRIPYFNLFFGCCGSRLAVLFPWKRWVAPQPRPSYFASLLK